MPKGKGNGLGRPRIHPVKSGISSGGPAKGRARGRGRPKRCAHVEAARLPPEFEGRHELDGVMQVDELPAALRENLLAREEAAARVSPQSFSCHAHPVVVNHPHLRRRHCVRPCCPPLNKYAGLRGAWSLERQADAYRRGCGGRPLRGERVSQDHGSRDDCRDIPKLS